MWTSLFTSAPDIYILAARYLRTVYAVQPNALARLFGLDREQLAELLEELKDAQQARVDGEWVLPGRTK